MEAGASSDMKRRHNRTMVERWLAAESVGSDDEADRLFRSVFRSLPALAPADRFVEQVMAAVAVAGVGPILSRGWAKAAILFGVVWIGMLGRLVPAATLLGSGPSGAGEVVRWIARIWVHLGIGLGRLESSLSVARTASDAFRSIALSPEGTLLLALTLLLGGASLVALHRLLGTRGTHFRIEP